MSAFSLVNVHFIFAFFLFLLFCRAITLIKIPTVESGIHRFTDQTHVQKHNLEYLTQRSQKKSFKEKSVIINSINTP